MIDKSFLDMAHQRGHISYLKGVLKWCLKYINDDNPSPSRKAFVATAVMIALDYNADEIDREIFKFYPRCGEYERLEK